MVTKTGATRGDRAGKNSKGSALFLPETDVAPRSRHRPLAAGCTICPKLVVERVLATRFGFFQRAVDVDLSGVVLGVGDGVDAHRRTDGIGSKSITALDFVECAGFLDGDHVPGANIILKGLLQVDSV